MRLLIIVTLFLASSRLVASDIAGKQMENYLYKKAEGNKIIKMQREKLRKKTKLLWEKKQKRLRKEEEKLNEQQNSL